MLMLDFVEIPKRYFANGVKITQKMLQDRKLDGLVASSSFQERERYTAVGIGIVERPLVDKHEQTKQQPEMALCPKRCIDSPKATFHAEHEDTAAITEDCGCPFTYNSRFADESFT
jgi:hypothetical protein